MPVSTHHTTGKSSKVQAALWDMTLMPLKSGKCGFKLTFIKCEWHITDTHNKTGLTSNGMLVGVKLLQLWGGAIQSCLQLLQLRGSCSYSEKTLQNDEFKDGFRVKACWIAAAAVLEMCRYNVDTVKGWTILVLWFDNWKHLPRIGKDYCGRSTIQYLMCMIDVLFKHCSGLAVPPLSFQSPAASWCRPL